jgi:iron complex outermembrane receptor protein
VETAPCRLAALVAIAPVLVAPHVRADDGEAELDPVTVTAEAPQPPASPGLETVQSDTIDLEESDTTWLTLEDVLESTPSVRVRSFGAPGSPSFLSVRGTAATHTLVVLDGVPLNDAATGFVDLSTVPVTALGKVTVIRGGHASGAGPTHPGGVVLLESLKPAPGLHGGASLTLGLYPLGPEAGGDGLKLRPARDVFTFGAQRRISLWQSWFGGSFGILAAGAYDSSAGDFAYLSDNGTVYDLSDDRYLARTNNGHEALSALLKLTWIPDMLSQVTLGAVLSSMHDGLPGIDVLPTTRSSLSRSRLNLSLSYRRWSEDLLALPALEASVLCRLTSLAFVDPLAEIALSGTDALSRDLLAGARLAVHDLRRAGVVLGGSLELTWEGWRSTSRLEGPGAKVTAQRLDVGLEADLTVPLLGSLLVLEASVSADIVHDVLGSATGETRLYPSPRAGLAASPLTWLRLTTSVAYAHRPPTFMELFGDGGTFRGNAELDPEHGVTADAGVDAALPEGLAGDLELSLRAALFTSYTVDLIVFIQNSQKTMIATNVEEALMRGLELTARVGWTGWASAELGYTLLDPVDRSGIEPYDGLMMPNRPRHDLFLEAHVGHWGVELSYLMDSISGGFVDRVNLDAISTRTIHTLKLGWAPAFAQGLSLELAWWNMGNAIVDRSDMLSSTGESYSRRRAVTDVDGYPLPGTALFLTLAYRG